MGMEIRQLHPLFAGEAGGIDLARRLDAAAVGAIWEAIDQYAVLVFHDQRLSDEQLRDFAGNFGELEIGRSAAEGGKRRLALPEIGDISNLDEAGRLRERNDRRRLDSLGNRIWHTDASYMPVPVVLGMLHAVAVPPRRLMNSRRCISAPKLRGQHCIGSEEYFDRAQPGHQNHCRSAQPMSLMDHKPRRRSGPGASLCPQYLRSRRNFVHRSERRQVPGAAVLRIRLERQDLPAALPRHQLTSSISLGRQLLSKNDSSGL